jgi:predicted NUDIX family phosphoesterase
MSKDEELVFAVDRSVLEPVISKMEDGLVYSENRDNIYDTIINNGKFVKRGPAEKDESLKQIIPYIVFEKEGKFFTMQRLNKSEEERLHNQFSIGAGGHINLVDNRGWDVIINAAKREIQEEVILENEDHGELKFLGFINDDENEVGKVHFGVLFLVRVSGLNDVEVKETDKLTGKWMSFKEILADDGAELETWSQHALLEIVDYLLQNELEIV